MTQRYDRYRRACGRRGVLILCVLVSLALAASLLGVWMKTLALERQEVRAEQARLQAEYLADAGVARAAAQLSADPTYAGETWQIPSESLASSAPAKVTIVVETSDDDPAARHVSASAQLADSGPARVARSKQQRILLPTEEQTP